MIYIPYARVNCLKTIPFTAAHTCMAHIWQYPPPGGFSFLNLNIYDVLVATVVVVMAASAP